jgi:hypothetical protein
VNAIVKGGRGRKFGGKLGSSPEDVRAARLAAVRLDLVGILRRAAAITAGAARRGIAVTPTVRPAPLP